MMKIKNRKKLFFDFLIVTSVTVFSLFLALVPASVNAQTDQTAPASNQAVVVATVNIYEAKIVSQKDRDFVLSFDIANREGAQAGIRYSVRLVKSTESEAVLYDEKVYSEVVNLGENSQIHKEILYQAPSNLSGKFELYVFAQNSDGLPLGIGRAGAAELKSVKGGLLISPTTCFLQVEGEKNSPRYTLSQGVDISANENLIVTCTVLNSGNNAITVTPVFETHHRTVFGEKVEQVGGSAEDVTLKSGNNKLTLTLPKAAKPQAYDVKLTLTDKVANLSSNSVVFHYVLRGASATIQNVLLDKDYYKKGETAGISFLWSPSADGFPGSRAGQGTALSGAALELSIFNSDALACADTLRQTLDQNNQNIDLKVPIKENCLNPKAFVTLKDASGAVIASREFAITSSATSVPPSSASGGIYMILALLILLIIILAAYFRHKKNQNES